MTLKERFLLEKLQLCDLYTHDGVVIYRNTCGDAAEIFAVVRSDGDVKLQANVYPFHMTVQPFTQEGLRRCKQFVRRWA